MKIILDKTENTLNISLDGRLDTNTAPEFESLVAENCKGAGEMIINCKKLAYVSSAGLRVLLFAQKKMGGNIKLVNVCDLVMEIFEITGFTEILTIE